MAEAYFKKGASVEVSSDDEGFRGAWFAATILKPPSKKTQKLVVEYKSLVSEKDPSKPLCETVDTVQVRPVSPRERIRIFKFSEEVDAFHNDGWWEGVVTQVIEGENLKYSVFFRGTREEMEFDGSGLRLHREWVNGSWVPPLEEDDDQKVPTQAKSSNGIIETYSSGTLVEVTSEEEGFEGAWFAGTVIKSLGKDKFLVEYQNLRTEDDTEFLKEEFDSQHIRPCPPETFLIDQFKLHEEVDALYNDGWWVGVIVKVLGRSRYLVYFRSTDEETVYEHDKLRLHQDWVDGKWVMASRALKL